MGAESAVLDKERQFNVSGVGNYNNYHNYDKKKL